MRLRFMAVPTVMERKPGSPWGWRHRGSVPGARVVKAANTLAAAVLGSDPNAAGGKRVIFLSGDDADAKSRVITLFEDSGYSTIDLGDLATGGRMQQVHGPLAGVNLIRVLD